MNPDIIAVGRRLCDKWLALVRVAESGAAVAVNDDLRKLTSDVTSLLSFGHDFNSLERPEGSQSEDLAAIPGMVFKRTLIPVKYWRIPVLGRFLCGAAKERRLLRRVDRLLDGIIRRAKNKTTAGGDSTGSSSGSGGSKDKEETLSGGEAAARTKPATLLAKMLQQLERDGGGGGKETYNLRRRLAGNLLSLFVAGTDTTSVVLSWMLLHLAKDAELQQQCRVEASQWDDAAFARGGSKTSESTASNIERILTSLPTLHALFLEVMRCSGPLPSIFLSPHEDFTVCGSAFKGSNKTALTFIAATEFIHSLPTAAVHFGPHPERFDARRWLLEEGVRVRLEAAAKLLTFGHGPRICPGKDLAAIEALLVAALLLRTFTFRLPSVDDENAAAREMQTEPVGRVTGLVCGPDKDILLHLSVTGRL